MSTTIWKTVACPYCGSKPGESCGRTSHGAFTSWWVRTAPHQARKDSAKAAAEAKATRSAIATATAAPRRD